jgi:hypothetical protein
MRRKRGMERAVVILIGIVPAVIPLPRIIRHERGLLMLILKLFEFVVNLLKFLKRMLPLRLIFWLLYALQDRPGRHFESSARVLGIASPWWRLRGRDFVSDKLCRLAESCPCEGGGRPECYPPCAGSRSLPAGGGSLFLLAWEFPIAQAGQRSFSRSRPRSSSRSSRSRGSSGSRVSTPPNLL